MMIGRQKRAVVIGAGAGGLSTAVQLARQGWDVTVLEKEPAPGGRLGAIEADGFRIDLGATILMMHDVFQQFFADLGKNLQDYLHLTRLNPCATDLKHNLDEIRALCPGDVEGYLKYLAQIHKRYMIARYAFIEKPMTRLRDFFNLKTLADMWRLRTFNSMHADICRFVRDERVRISLTFQAMYLGVSPYRTPSIYTIIPYVEHAHSGVWYPRGGMSAITRALVRLLEEFGGELRLNSRVENIIIENGRAKGVLLGDGTRIAADVVISNVDFPNTMQQLMPGTSRGKYTPAKCARMKNSCGCMMMYLGSKRTYDSLGVHNIYFSADHKKSLEQIFNRARLPDDPAIYLYAPSRIDPAVAPAGHEVIYVLVPVPNLAGSVDWDKDGPDFQRKVFDKLEACGLSGLRGNIVFEKYADPTVFAERFNTFQGAGFGLAPTLFQSGYFRPGIKSTTVAGLYFAGASVHPGGGVPVVLVCGRLVARQIHEDCGMQWLKSGSRESSA